MKHQTFFPSNNLDHGNKDDVLKETATLPENEGVLKHPGPPTPDPKSSAVFGGCLGH